MQIQQKSLYILILSLVLAIVVAALGGGLFHQQSPWYLQWQHQLFDQLCHQIPERSFVLNSQPMAVCSRCIGIYGGFAIGWMMLPLGMISTKANRFYAKRVALAVLLINLVDIVGNMLGFWQNTLVSRLMLGSLMGLSAAFIFSGDFFIRTLTSIGNHHGRTRAADTAGTG